MNLDGVDNPDNGSVYRPLFGQFGLPARRSGDRNHCFSESRLYRVHRHHIGVGGVSPDIEEPHYEKLQTFEAFVLPGADDRSDYFS